ncbi:MAG: hypoxanthine phosphoribosyltransferase [Actinomycetota bacterium]
MKSHPDISQVLLSAEQIRDRVHELASSIDEFYSEKSVLLVGVLKGAVPFVADLARAMEIPTTMDWMAVSSYGSGTSSSGVVRILKDLDTDVTGRDVLLVEDIIDSGLTLSWLTANLRARGANSLEIVTLLRKPDAARVKIDVRWVGFDIPNEFVVGYGLDYDEKYRNLDGIGILSPNVYS